MNSMYVSIKCRYMRTEYVNDILRWIIESLIRIYKQTTNAKFPKANYYKEVSQSSYAGEPNLDILWWKNNNILIGLGVKNSLMNKL
jgi:hypothetical protein